jgi:hypothetical protein
VILTKLGGAQEMRMDYWILGNSAVGTTALATAGANGAVYIAREMMAIGLNDVRIVARGQYYAPNEFADLCCERKPRRR